MARELDEQPQGKIPRISLRHLLPYSLIFVLAPIITYILGRWLDSTLHLPAFPPFPVNLCAGLSVFSFGLAIGIKATRLLYSVGQGLPWGELRKQARSTRLVTGGLYAYCRNPMTFGYSLLPCGMGLMFQSLGMAFFIPAGIFSVMIIWLKAWEEPGLERRFGEAYQEYKRRTPFLIPRFKPLVLDAINPVVLTLRQTGGDARRTRFSLLSLAYVGTSLLGLCLLALLTFKVPTFVTNAPLRKQLTGSIFVAICIFGLIAGVFPSKFRQVLHSKKAQGKIHPENEKGASKEDAAEFRGHHPTCGNFSAHVLQLGERTYCAGCTGLVTGATLALVASFAYFLTGVSAGGSGLPVFWLGFIGVVCGLLQYSLIVQSGAIHFSLNVGFVLGAFLLLVGVTALNDNFVLEFYLLALIVYWIMARIMLSRFEHMRICATCSLKPCGLSFG